MEQLLVLLRQPGETALVAVHEILPDRDFQRRRAPVGKRLGDLGGSAPAVGPPDLIPYTVEDGRANVGLEAAGATHFDVVEALDGGEERFLNEVGRVQEIACAHGQAPAGPRAEPRQIARQEGFESDLIALFGASQELGGGEDRNPGLRPLGALRPVHGGISGSKVREAGGQYRHAAGGGSRRGEVNGRRPLRSDRIERGRPGGWTPPGAMARKACRPRSANQSKAADHPLVLALELGEIDAGSGASRGTPAIPRVRVPARPLPAG